MIGNRINNNYNNYNNYNNRINNRNHQVTLTTLYSKNVTTSQWPIDGRDTLPYTLKSTTPLQESTSPLTPTPTSSSLGVYDLPPNLGKGDIITFPDGIEGGPGREIKYKVKRVRFLYKYSMTGGGSFKVTKKILEVTEVGRDKVERL
eukprot:CAMPEP_0118666976 /NCGR_PEP_ID=MMETSP0785-20121206/19520_1 /TAXON_ID=91992 /ORGANISM="Bolidomonas pacifica, Strain CCMP 1866" /LENGTH=146 /DNA_ID=CAMNT_0006561359 /DNA_START=258 /DNA_END=695 /DNA_ORIENTATION=+